MTFKTRELTVDLVNEISTKEIRFSQGDRNSAKLVLNITNEGQELDLSQAKAVRITFKKPDGTTVFQEDLQPINATKGKYQIILKTQTLAAAGNVYGQVRIFEKDQELDAEPFGFTVKQSYSGNGAVESTNEFTIIQKAIEAGEKLKGVDIDGIIAAGAKADAAVKKAGDTMTGDLNMNVDRNVTFKGSNDNEFKIRAQAGNNKLIMQKLHPTEGNKFVWEYQASTDTFTLNSTTNLVKKSENYSEFTQPDGRAITITGQDLNTIIKAGQYSGQNMLNTPDGAAASSKFFYIEVVKHTSSDYAKQTATTLAVATPMVWVRLWNKGVWGEWIQQLDINGGTVANNFIYGTGGKGLIWRYGEFMDTGIMSTADGKQLYMKDWKRDKVLWSNDDNGFNVNAANLVKKSGEVMTGDLQLDRPTGASYRELKWTTGGDIDVVLGQDVGGNWRAYHSGAGNSIFSYDKTAKSFNILAPNTNVVTKTKDGKVTLTLTADATAGSATPQLATRKGNVVTVNLDVVRNAGATGLIVTTLPADMCPTESYAFDAIAVDGTPSRVMVRYNGEIYVDAPGKRFRILTTFVVN
ncbi:BppU family phage baseplate upper protein [Bacillus cereus]|uniref:BppU family phage baseplate upper protein n=1 Tax=Bacillus cereus TaxID=1396 RepID=UPI002221D9A3|nr:BppU family phage baseplate upper protein [Bacillus cereus]